jgi:hypothetical protein
MAHEPIAIRLQRTFGTSATICMCDGNAPTLQAIATFFFVARVGPVAARVTLSLSARE